MGTNLNAKKHWIQLFFLEVGPYGKVQWTV